MIYLESEAQMTVTLDEIGKGRRLFGMLLI
jgi:hypothetical protein